jgi:acyl-coenzyme A thioesterase PaaI-like protein
MTSTSENASQAARIAAMAQLDEAMVQVALLRVNAGDQAPREVVAVDMHLSFIQPAAGPLVATAQVVGGGKTMVFCEAQLRNAEGAVAAQAMGTYRAQGHQR